MSVLSFPRIVLNGTTSWNPATQNNNIDLGYAKDPVKVALPKGETYETFDDWLIALNDKGMTNGDWDVFGQHHSIFDATVANTLAGPGNSPAGDALVGGKLAMTGGVPKLVDVNPYSPFTSQVFLNTIRLSSDGGGFSGRAAHRMTSRRFFGTRNIRASRMPIAGPFGVIWQTVIAKEDIKWSAGSSPTLAALQDAMSRADVLGLMLRVVSYTTIYFKEIVEGGWTDQSDMKTVYKALADRYRAASPVNPGNIASTFNPAISSLTGAIGLWQAGDMMTVPNERVMGAPAGGGGNAPALGAASAQVNADQGCISLDLLNAVPETDEKNTKADLGKLNLVATFPDQTQEIVGVLDSADYAQAAYEKGGGIVDVKPNVDPATLSQAMLSLVQDSSGDTVLEELVFRADADFRSVYAEVGGSGTIEVQVGSTYSLPAGLTLYAKVTEPTGGNPPIALTGGSGTSATERSFPVGADGKVTIGFSATQPGNCLVEVAASANGTPDIPDAPTPTTGYAAIRVMPTDEEISNVKDEDLTWEFVYDNVLRPFDLVYRGMSCGVFNLGDEASVRAHANSIAGLTDPAMFTSPLYMPVTRDLSSGRRKLLMRFLGMDDSGTPVG